MPNATTSASTPKQEEDTAAPVLAASTDEIVQLLNTTILEKVENSEEVGELEKELSYALDEARKSMFNSFGLPPLIDLLSTFTYFSQATSPPSLMCPPTR